MACTFSTPLKKKTNSFINGNNNSNQMDNDNSSNLSDVTEEENESNEHKNKKYKNFGLFRIIISAILVSLFTSYIVSHLLINISKKSDIRQGITGESDFSQKIKEIKEKILNDVEFLKTKSYELGVELETINNKFLINKINNSKYITESEYNNRKKEEKISLKESIKSINLKIEQFLTTSKKDSIKQNIKYMDSLKNMNKTINYIKSQIPSEDNKSFDQKFDKLNNQNKEIKILLNEKLGKKIVLKDEFEERMVKMRVAFGEIVKEAVAKYLEGDKVDWAFAHSGGHIVSVSNQYSKINNYFYGKKPWRIIDSTKGPGYCFAFKPKGGYVVIGLRKKIFPSGFSYRSIYKKTNPYMDSIPKEFKVVVNHKNQNIELKSKTNNGRFIYDPNGETEQFFEFEKVNFQIMNIRFDFVSNWGNKEYTCVYRIKVHGE